MYLVGTVYDSFAYHKSLRVSLHLTDDRRRWLYGTPAIVASITDHLWTVKNYCLSGYLHLLGDHQGGEDALRLPSDHL